MINTNTTTETSYDGIERTKSRIYRDDGSLLKIIETTYITSSDYHQTLVRNGEGYPLYWYDNLGEYQKFNWYSIPDKKGNPVWYSDIVHSTVHAIYNGIQYSLKGFEKFKKHKFDKKYGESYE